MEGMPDSVALPTSYPALVAAIARARGEAQRQALQAINVALTLRNWLIGGHIVEYEQHGSDRAQYGERLLASLAKDLRSQAGRGFGQRNLFSFREFYLRYAILQSAIAKFGIVPPDTSTLPSHTLDWQDSDHF